MTTYWTINKSGKVIRFNYEQVGLLPKVKSSAHRKYLRLKREGLLFETKEQAEAHNGEA